MTGQVESAIAKIRDRLQRILVREHKAMVQKGKEQRSALAKRCQCYMDELEVAERILLHVWDIRQVNYGLILRLRDNGSELEEILDGAFVNVSKVKKTGVYFIALTPVEEI